MISFSKFLGRRGGDMPPLPFPPCLPHAEHFPCLLDDMLHSSPAPCAPSPCSLRDFSPFSVPLTISGEVTVAVRAEVLSGLMPLCCCCLSGFWRLFSVHFLLGLVDWLACFTFLVCLGRAVAEEEAESGWDTCSGFIHNIGGVSCIKAVSPFFLSMTIGPLRRQPLII